MTNIHFYILPKINYSNKRITTVVITE
jgi:hypothetical protein